MSTPSYAFGQDIDLSVTFGDNRSGSSPVDPATVTAKVHDPAGTVTTYTLAGGGVTKLGTGRYRVTVPGVVRGTWHCVWSCTSPNGASSPHYFAVT